MKHKILSLLVLLLTAATGAWATDTYTITFSGFGNEACNKTVTDATLEYSETFNVTDVYANYTMLGGVFSSNEYVSISKSQDEKQITITVKSAFEGTVNVTVYYMNDNFDETQSDISVTCVKSAPAIEVTTNAASEGATFTEASFQMPAYDATVDYELVRDMAVDVNAVIADRIRIKKDGTTYVPVTATELVPVITDALDEQNPVIMVLYDETAKTGDYTVKLQKKVEGETPSWADATALSVGTFRYVITGANLYDGITYTPEFQLFEGYPLEIAKGEYATFYGAEAVVADAETSSDAVLYTISSVSGDKAVLSDPITVAPKETPLLVYNNSEETKTFLLIPTTDPNLALTVAPEFTGTLTGTTIAASDANTTNYAFNGKQFVYVKNAIAIGANKAWLAISATNAPVINLVFGDATGVNAIDNGQLTIDNWYDLNGRKLQGVPTKKGVYIMNGKKVVVK